MRAEIIRKKMQKTVLKQGVQISGGNICRIPKPIVEMLGVAGSVKFINKKGKMSVEADNT